MTLLRTLTLYWRSRGSCPSSCMIQLWAAASGLGLWRHAGRARADDVPSFPQVVHYADTTPKMISVTCHMCNVILSHHIIMASEAKSVGRPLLAANLEIFRNNYCVTQVILPESAMTLSHNFDAEAGRSILESLVLTPHPVPHVLHPTKDRLPR